jgi:hypothetical protein
MTTEDTPVEITQPRSIGELLSLTTYQGMSDEEINSIIDFKCDLARSDSVARAQQQTNLVAMNSMVELHTKALEESTRLYEGLLSRETKPAIIEDVDATVGGVS